MTVTTLVPCFGSNRMLAEEPGKLLGPCTWVGIPFAGGMAELPHISARTIVVNDLHRHVINLARVVADDELRPKLVRILEQQAFHPDTLQEAQLWCRDREAALHRLGQAPCLEWAFRYFVASWMGRSSQAGTGKEFEGGLALRWNASGGDSAVRYRSAVKMLDDFSKTLRRCTLSTLDAFEWFQKVQDRPGHGLYCDPPFLGAGVDYKHNAGTDPAQQVRWHARLRAAVERFRQCKVVLRFHRHEEIERLYGRNRWAWHEFTGRTQANKEASELLLVNEHGS